MATLMVRKENGKTMTGLNQGGFLLQLLIKLLWLSNEYLNEIEVLWKKINKVF